MRSSISKLRPLRRLSAVSQLPVIRALSPTYARTVPGRSRNGGLPTLRAREACDATALRQLRCCRQFANYHGCPKVPQKRSQRNKVPTGSEIQNDLKQYYCPQSKTSQAGTKPVAVPGIVKPQCPCLTPTPRSIK